MTNLARNPIYGTLVIDTPAETTDGGGMLHKTTYLGTPMAAGLHEVKMNRAIASDNRVSITQPLGELRIA